MKKSHTESIELKIETLNIHGSIPYSKYVAGQESACWFCGNKTKKYRAFEYKNFTSKPAGWAQIKNIESTIVLKIWTCPDCCEKIDSVKEIYESKQLKLQLILTSIGFLITTILLLIVDCTWGFSLFFGFMGGVALGILSIPIAKILAQNKTKGLKNEIRERLNKHPEVIAVHSEGYSRIYD